MSELFALLIGMCSLNWCAFSVTHTDAGFTTLNVRVYDKASEIVEVHHFPLSGLIQSCAVPFILYGEAIAEEEALD